MRSSIKALTGAAAIFLLAIAPPRQKTATFSEFGLPESTEPTRATGAKVASHVGTELSSELIETDVHSNPQSYNSAPFEAFDHWLNTYQESTVKTPALLRDGERVVIERRAALAQLIENDPEQALRLAVPYEARK